ncbi:hypothetical protein CYLTODRAFT_183854 [Cylindrobasidium torrendii FP15055 ss-10]|uniref:Uncharacterized protein n=1 Tax=Cylindrobasidium torrendii FP15055 ss-10 TaxID=1314674 RepID=A0A0D7BJJ1_9AGAR|nr:hypothetical protein CYLTODRAFT_183854 [Cylindrobasidium torrendii FP15055 ss-10]
MSIKSLSSSSGSSTSLAPSMDGPEPSSVSSSLSSSPTNSKLLDAPPPTSAKPKDKAKFGPRGILLERSRTPSSASCSSLPSTASGNIKFAPLPELAPRRRKSSVPLGVAARSQMMARRRGQPIVEPGTGVWTEQEMEDHRRRVTGEQRGDVEDPFLALGRIMKGAWRKMNGKEEKPSVPKTGRVVTGMVDNTNVHPQDHQTFDVHPSYIRSSVDGVEDVNLPTGDDEDANESGPPTPAKDFGETETIRGPAP